MGIINVTPDSFSDGGRLASAEAAVSKVTEMIAAGADFIDIGGESSRPFAEPVPPEEELNRVLPVIKAVRQHYRIPISIDTTKEVVARTALKAGADIINDISSFRFDPEMISLARESGVPVIIMHMKGTPRNMQIDPFYHDLMAEIIDFFEERIEWAGVRGVPREQLIIDPGLGFGKTVSHNLTIIKHLSELRNLGCPILVGHSRKSFIGKTVGIEAADERDGATAVLSAICAGKGAAILRVHDVRQTIQAIRLQEAIDSAS